MQVIYPLSTADAIAKLGLGTEVTEGSRKALEQRLDELMEAVRLLLLLLAAVAAEIALMLQQICSLLLHVSNIFIIHV